jgi:hypothetical protein
MLRFSIFKVNNLKLQGKFRSDSVAPNHLLAYVNFIKWDSYFPYELQMSKVTLNSGQHCNLIS